MSTTVEAGVGQVVWHDLMTPDVEGAKGFYGQLLGWELEVWKPGEIDYPMISANGMQHGGIATLDPGSGARPHWLAYVRVDDVDATGERARGAGGSVIVPPTDIPEVGRFAVLADPAGAAIACFAPAQSMPLPQGVFAWDELLATDVAAARAFYGAVFGWDAREWEGPSTYTLFRNGDGTDVAGALTKMAEDPGPPRWLSYLSTDDVDAALERARGLGAAVYLEPMDVPDVGRLAVLGDPSGADFGLFRAAGQ